MCIPVGCHQILTRQMVRFTFSASDCQLLPVALFAANRCQCEWPCRAFQGAWTFMHVLQKILGFGVCVSNLYWVSIHLISLRLIPFFRFKFVFVCVYESVYIQMPSPAVTESPHWLSDIQKSLWHEMNGQFWQAAPQSSLQDFPKALPFCYVQYLQLYCLCVLIIVCDSWQVYKRYTINLPIECFSVQVWDIISCFSYLRRRYQQVHVITIVVGCFPANLREDRAFRQREVWVHLKSFYRTCQNWTLPP